MHIQALHGDAILCTNLPGRRNCTQAVCSGSCHTIYLRVLPTDANDKDVIA